MIVSVRRNAFERRFRKCSVWINEHEPIPAGDVLIDQVEIERRLTSAGCANNG